MPVAFTGFVSAETTVSNTDTLPLVITDAVPRTSPALPQWVVVAVQADGDPSVGFGGTIYSVQADDSAEEDPCYGSLYGDGNEYVLCHSTPLAGSVTLNTDFSWTQLWWACILHPLAVGDTISIVFSTQATAGVMKEIRGRVMLLSGIDADPEPLLFTSPAGGVGGWTQARVIDWNQFDGGVDTFIGSINAGMAPADFVTKDIQSDEAFFGSDSWGNECLFAWSLFMGALQPNCDGFAFANGDLTTVLEWYQFSDANLCLALAMGEMGASADDDTQFGGTASRDNPLVGAISFGTNAETRICPRIICSADGPEYDDPSACAGGLFIDRSLGRAFVAAPSNRVEGTVIDARFARGADAGVTPPDPRTIQGTMIHNHFGRGPEAEPGT